MTLIKSYLFLNLGLGLLINGLNATEVSQISSLEQELSTLQASQQGKITQRLDELKENFQKNLNEMTESIYKTGQQSTSRMVNKISLLPITMVQEVLNQRTETLTKVITLEVNQLSKILENF